MNIRDVLESSDTIQPSWCDVHSISPDGSLVASIAGSGRTNTWHLYVLDIGSGSIISRHAAASNLAIAEFLPDSTGIVWGSDWQLTTLTVRKPHSADQPTELSSLRTV